MFNQLFQPLVSRRSVKLPNLSLILAVGLAMVGANPVLASGLEIAQSGTQTQANETVALQQMPNIDSALPEGTYLYGESSKAEQVGKQYVLFQVQRGKVMGAVYMPASEFSCFSGTIDNNKLSMTVKDPYEQTTYAYSIPVERINQQVATVGGRLPKNNVVGLEGFQRINKISANDQRILRSCR